MDRKPFSHGLLLAALALGGSLAGCGESHESEFQSYSELESAQRPSGPDPVATGTANESAPNAGSDAVSPDAGTARKSANGVSPALATSASRGEADAEGPIVAPQPARTADGQSGASAGPAPQTAGDSSDAVPSPGPDPAAARLAMLQRPAGDPPVEAPRPEPREITLLVPFREFRVEGPEGAIRVSYDDLDLLKILNMEPVRPDCVAYFPEWLRNLDGKRIRLRGFMYPPFETTGIRGFVLARDNQICCFGRNPKPYDLIEVFMRKGETTDYIQNRPFDVVGVFHIVPQTAGDLMYRLYEIEDAVVIDR